MRLYTRTLRSEHAVATMGRDGCAAVCQVRELDGGERLARGEILGCGASAGAAMVERRRRTGSCDDSGGAQ